MFTDNDEYCLPWKETISFHLRTGIQERPYAIAAVVKTCLRDKMNFNISFNLCLMWAKTYESSSTRRGGTFSFHVCKKFVQIVLMKVNVARLFWLKIMPGIKTSFNVDNITEDYHQE